MLIIDYSTSVSSLICGQQTKWLLDQCYPGYQILQGLDCSPHHSRKIQYISGGRSKNKLNIKKRLDIGT